MRALAAALLTGLWLAPPAAARELSGRLSLAGIGSRPAAGATVAAVPFESADDRARREARGEPAPRAIAETTAGEDGRFALALPETSGPLPLQVRISGEGLVPVAVVRVVAGPDADDLGEIVVPEAEPLSGRVVGPAGGPVVGAEVIVSAVARGWSGLDYPLSSMPQSTTTDAEGRFRFESASKRENRLEVRALGLAPVTHEPLAAGDLATPVALVPGRLLAGRVLGPDRETPAAGALVRFESRGSVSAWHEAGPDGGFRLEDVAEGPGLLRVEAAGRGRAEQRVEGDEDPDETLEVVLGEPAGFRGRVVEAETGRGVAGASVLLHGLGQVWAATADGDGRWSQAGLPPGTWGVRIEAPGRVPWLREEVRLGAAADEVLDAVLERAAALRGRVVDEEGEPVAGARCRLERTGETGWEAFMSRVRNRGAVRSDAEGRFELSGLPAGAGQSLLVEHDDYAATHLGGIDLVPGQPAQTITVVLSPGLGLGGRVVDVDGAPVDGADVTLDRTRRASFGGFISYSSGDRRSAKTDARGAFAFHGLELTGYEVRARHDGYAAADLGVVEVSDETQGEPLEIVLQPGAAIRGVVLTPGGEPAAGYRVMASPAGSGRPGMIQLPDPTGLDGVFVVEGLEVGGRYDLQLLGDGSEVDRRDGVVAPVEGVELRAPGDGRIEVVAQDARGAPLTEFEVSYQPTGQRMFGFPNPRPGYGSNRIAARSGDGRYVMDVPAGTWRVEVQARGYQTGRSGEVVVEAGRTTAGVVVRLEEGHAIRGRVLSARDRRPVADARVLAESAGSMYFGPANPNERRTDAEGAFEIDGLAPGPYTVVARHPDWSETSQSVKLERGVEVELLMGEGSRITGTVISANTPVGGADVSLVVAGDPRAAMRTNRTAVSDAGGRFTFEHLSPGRYTVSAQLRGRTGQGVEVVVAADAGVSDVVVALDGGTHIAGVVEGLEADRLRQVSVIVSGPAGFRVQVRPGADGHFDVTGAPAGAVRVAAMLGSWEQMRQISEELVIAEGQAEAAVALRFETGFRLEGRVTRAGAPVDGASLSLGREDGGGYATGRTGADGRYAFDDLREGSWTLHVRVESRRSAGTTREVEITGDALLDVELDTARIAGRVVDADTGAPLSGASVTIVDPAEDRSLGGTQTDSDGRFAVEDLEPGPYQAHVRKAAYQQRVVDVTASSTSDVLVELERGEGITLVARDGIHGTPLRSLQVRVLDASGATYYAGVVLLDSEGRGDLQSLPPGSYRLRASAEGYAATADLPLAVPSAGPSLVLTPGGALEVHAGSETLGRPDAGFRLLRPDGSAYVPQLHRTDPQVPLTGPVTRLSHVLPGDYLLVAAGGGSHEVRVREGAAVVVELP